MFVNQGCVELSGSQRGWLGMRRKTATVQGMHVQCKACTCNGMYACAMQGMQTMKAKQQTSVSTLACDDGST